VTFDGFRPSTTPIHQKHLAWLSPLLPIDNRNYVTDAWLYNPPVFYSVLSLDLTPASPLEPSGSWDSIHVFETVERGRQAHYKLTSTIMLQLVTHRESAESSSGAKDHMAWKNDGEISLSGSMTRQVCIAACVAAGELT
jgi:F-actin capping protein, beta subunit